MAKYIGADSLAFISIDGLYKAVKEPEGRNNAKPQYCDACFTGDYPIPLLDRDTPGEGSEVTYRAEARG
jgi:amidophosphoribosyltransferase